MLCGCTPTAKCMVPLGFAEKSSQCRERPWSKCDELCNVNNETSIHLCHAELSDVKTESIQQSHSKTHDCFKKAGKRNIKLIEDDSSAIFLAYYNIWPNKDVISSAPGGPTWPKPWLWSTMARPQGHSGSSSVNEPIGSSEMLVLPGMRKIYGNPYIKCLLLLQGKRVMCPHVLGCLDFIPPMLDQDAWSCRSRARSPRCEDAWWSSRAWRKAWHQALRKEVAMFSFLNHPKLHSRCQQMPTESATCILHGVKTNQILSSPSLHLFQGQTNKTHDMLIFRPLEGQVVVTKGDLIITSLNRSRRKKRHKMLTTLSDAVLTWPWAISPTMLAVSTFYCKCRPGHLTKQPFRQL